MGAEMRKARRTDIDVTVSLNQLRGKCRRSYSK